MSSKPRHKFVVATTVSNALADKTFVQVEALGVALPSAARALLYIALKKASMLGYGEGMRRASYVDRRAEDDTELSEAREALRLAVQNLEQTDARIAEMRETLRDKFAAAVLTGLIAANNMRVDDMPARAYQISDLMLVSRVGSKS